jgi:hypothetical protein
MLRLVFRFSVRRDVHGIQLVVPAANDHADGFFAKMQQALDIIRDADSRRWARIRRHLRRIVLLNGGGEFYHPELHAYVVDLPSFLARSPLEVASSVVHEATHARLHHKGISYEPSIRERVEMVCVGEEIAFLQRLGNTEELVARKRSSLESQWWSETSLHQRRFQQLQAHGVPRVLVRMFDRFRRFTRLS